MFFSTLIHKEVVVPDAAELYFVGDLHGSYNLLRTIKSMVDFQPGLDHLVCVGDLADRGTQSLECVTDFVFDNPRHHCVMGNHDMLLATANIRSDSLATLLYNGGQWAMDLSEDTFNLISQNILKNIPIFMTIHHRGKKYGVVHGEIPVSYKERGDEFNPVNWNDTIAMVEKFCNRQQFSGPYWRMIDTFIWGRDVIGYHKEGKMNIPDVDGVDYVLHGHTVLENPTMVKNRFYLDTGGVFYNRLSIARATPEGFEVATTDPAEENGIWQNYQK